MKLRLKNSIYGWVVILILTLGAKNAKAQGQLMIKLSPLSWLGPSTPTLQAGIEYRFYKNLALEVDYGFQTKTVVFHWNDDKDQNKYYKIKTELKYYRKLSKNTMYWGLGVFYLPQSYNYSHGTFVNEGVIYDYESAHLKRDVSVFCIKAGYVTKISKLFSVDLFAGIGLRYINTKHSDVIGLEQQVVQPFSEGFGVEYDYYEGNKYKLHIETGVKLNILILKEK